MYFKLALIAGLSAVSVVRAQSTATGAGDDAAALQQKLANPVASLRTLPLQSNFDFGLGPNKDGFRYTLNIQPVLPFSLSPKWNLISRTIVPLVSQSGVIGNSSQTGLGDTAQTFYFSPNTNKSVIWGAGPSLLIPTATNEVLGSKKLGLGVSGVVLKQSGQWTVGGLVTEVWSVAGQSRRADFAITALQPFLTYNTKNRWILTAQTETTHEWKSNTWNVPILLQAAKLLIVGKTPVTVGGGLRCWANSPAGGPRGCGFRLFVTPLFPKR